MQKKHTKAATAYSIIAFILFMPAGTALAGIGPIGGGDCAAWGIRCTGGDGPSNIIDYIWLGLDVAMAFLATIAAAALTYYGIMYIISRGDEERARRAKTGILYALLGILVVGLAAWIVNSIINL
jgi:hypothetical protein